MLQNRTNHLEILEESCDLHLSLMNDSEIGTVAGNDFHFDDDFNRLPRGWGFLGFYPVPPSGNLVIARAGQRLLYFLARMGLEVEIEVKNGDVPFPIPGAAPADPA